MELFKENKVITCTIKKLDHKKKYTQIEILLFNHIDKESIRKYW